jgi:hypothetical protein
MPFITGARFRAGVEAGAEGDTTGYGPALSAGTPAAGTAGFGAGTLEPAALVLDTTNKKAFINTGTKASPTWTVVGSQS